MKLELKVLLKSDTTFGSGQGVTGSVDIEVEHDDYGLPFIRGRSIKSLLVEECANILYSLTYQKSSADSTLREAAAFLFGRPGSVAVDQGSLRIGPALLPSQLRHAVMADVDSGRLLPPEVLESLTAIRVQTSIDAVTGAPEKGSLRASRVVLRETPFTATLEFTREAADEHLALLAACVKSVRRGGTGSNRGRGRLMMSLHKDDDREVTKDYFGYFRDLVRGADIEGNYL
ncbi:MAG: hypothetical protein M1553_01040 [Firmicutes bacterium]|nr:hypothetical protein [Bacillota bacterium]